MALVQSGSLMSGKQKKYKPDTVRAAFRKYFVGDEGEDGEQRAFCPICEDPDSSKSPSASFNSDSGLWNCLKGNHGGSIYNLVADLKKERGFDIRKARLEGMHADPGFREEATNRLNTSKRNALPSAERISEWKQSLLDNEDVLSPFLEYRGFTKETLDDFDIGWDGSRYTIPVYDDLGEVVNVRKYKLGAATHEYKFTNVAGHGQARVYGLDTLKESEEIVFSEGEFDRIMIMQNGIPAVTGTGGAGTFKREWGPLFKGKFVYLCFDNDDTGRKGAVKAAQNIKPYANAVYTVILPLKDTGADSTDYFHGAGYTAEDFRTLMRNSRMVQGGELGDVPESGKNMSLIDSMAQENQSETVELVVSVTGKQFEPFTAPKKVIAECDMSKGAACSVCPLAQLDGRAEVDISPNDEQIFRFIDTSDQRRVALLRSIFGSRCTDRVEYETEENYHIEELLVQHSVDERNDAETQRPVRRTAFSIGTHRTAVNEKLRLVGRNVEDPKTGRLRFMAWVNEGVEMDIDRFVLTDELRERLRVFQPSEDQLPLDKCVEIARDMSENVTHIYGRDILHVAYDLVWHSVMSFRVGDRVERKGWLEGAIIGDTRTGKSEIASRLIRHYQSGQLISCEGMSFAGIVGGVQQIDGRWHLTWGAVPMNDRRLVILDEMSGLRDKNVIEQMSSIRSSGIAQITKIYAEQTSARTRLMWLSNAADGSMLEDFPDVGMAALRTIIPNNEDIARFDFVAAAAKDEVSNDKINIGFSEMHSPTYRPSDCEALIKWAWSLTRDDVVFTESAASESNKQAISMSRRYIADPPLVQGENVRFKILRLAAAIAARTFSIDNSDRLVVKREHVRDAVRFLDEIYGSEAMGYLRKSKRSISAAAKAKARRASCINYLKQNEDTVLLALQMVGGKTFRTRDFTDFAAMSQDEAQMAVKRLMSWKMVHRKSGGNIGMDPMLIEILREIEDEEPHED